MPHSYEMEMFMGYHGKIYWDYNGKYHDYIYKIPSPIHSKHLPQAMVLAWGWSKRWSLVGASLICSTFLMGKIWGPNFEHLWEIRYLHSLGICKISLAGFQWQGSYHQAAAEQAAAMDSPNGFLGRTFCHPLVNIYIAKIIMFHG